MNDECGAYVCFSNPQNLDIGKLLGGAVENSPFYKILNHEDPPEQVILITNQAVAIHTRLWCVLEAFAALQNYIEILGSGPVFDLLTGAKGMEVKEQLRAALLELESAATINSGEGAIEGMLRFLKDCNSPARRRLKRARRMMQTAIKAVGKLKTRT